VDVESSTETSSGVHHPGSLDAIHVLTRYRVELDAVTRRDVLQSPEGAIAVSRDAQVAVRSRRCRALDVTDGAIERAVVGAGQHRHLESNLGDSEHGERSRSRFEKRLTPGNDVSSNQRDWSGVPPSPVANRSAAKRSSPCRVDVATPTWNAPHHTRPARPNAQLAHSVNSRSRKRVALIE
jgi:hypothetical protein